MKNVGRGGGKKREKKPNPFSSQVLFGNETFTDECVEIHPIKLCYHSNIVQGIFIVFCFSSSGVFDLIHNLIQTSFTHSMRFYEF